ncbi:MAG: adenosylcobinamide-GDP ribazoletransferase [Mycobacteriales bacterium]
MRAALAFLTAFGPGRAATPTPRTLDWFPLVGAVIGLAVGGVWWAADRIWAPIVAAGIAVAADLALTGCLHFDGLADTADGLLAPMSRARRLAAMRDPAIGAFGAIAVGIVLVLRFGAFAATTAAPLVIAALWCASRTAMCVIVATLPYARSEQGGLVTAFMGSTGGSGRSAGRERRARVRWLAPVVIGLALAVALAILGWGLHGLIAVAAGAVAAAAVALLARARIGGFTGDVLGAAGVLGETVGLLALAAR